MVDNRRRGKSHDRSETLTSLNRLSLKEALLTIQTANISSFVCFNLIHITLVSSIFSKNKPLNNMKNAQQKCNTFAKMK